MVEKSDLKNIKNVLYLDLPAADDFLLDKIQYDLYFYNYKTIKKKIHFVLDTRISSKPLSRKYIPFFFFLVFHQYYVNYENNHSDRT